MKRQEFLLNLTLLVIIGALIYLIYDSKDMPRGLDELPVPPAKVAKADGTGDGDGSDDSTSGTSVGDDMAPSTETEYASASATASPASADGAARGGTFGQRNLFRALLTPTPTPPPPTPTPAPTPDIAKALGAWKLTSVYEGKAYIEDVRKSAANEEGAIWEMAVGDTKQVDVGQGIMKTATLKSINASNPYNPDVTFTMEDTKAERNINLDTEPVGGAPAPAPKKK